MESNKHPKWYNYVAKSILIGMGIIIAPMLILIALSMNEHPLAIYRDIWYDR